MHELWGRSKSVGFSLALASAISLVALGGAAKADVFVVGNQSAFGNGLIETVDVTTHTVVNSFVPDQAKIGTNNGRGVAVLGTFVYYTELTNGFGPSTGVFVAPFNNGAGGADIKSFANPVPGTGVVDLAESGGKLYAMTGYNAGPEVVQATDGNGTNVGPLVTLHNLTGGNLTSSDGFTVLPNGNWLINTSDGANNYNQFNPVTGDEIAGTTITAPLNGTGGVCGQSTGVDNDGTFLYFDCNLDSIVQTTLTGQFVSITNFNAGGFEDISVIGAAPITPPVPEPASLAIFGSALAMFGWLRRRNRSA